VKAAPAPALIAAGLPYSPDWHDVLAAGTGRNQHFRPERDLYSRTGDRGDTEEKPFSEGGQAGVTGVTEVALEGMSVTPCHLLSPTFGLCFPFVSPLSPLSRPENRRVRKSR
jgi:hypothetical protein